MTSVETIVRAHVADHARRLARIDPDLVPVTELLGDMASRGKRLRAAFCLAGARGAAGGPLPPGTADVASALELFHLAALVHDDVMDHSEQRRGLPTVHRRCAAEHRRAGWTGDADAYGEAVAILVGDFCLSWADDLVDHGFADHDRRTRMSGRAVWSRMRDETIGGQFLDVLGQVQLTTSTQRAHVVLRFKSARYTVGHPLRLGGVLGGADEELMDSYEQIGLTAGEAFQLRDDVLGVFGDPEVTGKPVVDDIREGKRTLLVVVASERANPVQRQQLDRHLGDPGLTEDDLRTVREILADTGAVDFVEHRIEQLTHESLRIVDESTSDEVTRLALRDLIERCAWRRA
ncbi:polyprenyl synthetase family protein [Streptomyces sp. SID6673]|nr:polyprenyl synthetase family protein [Streptomyces sp. SID11726]NEB24363.1 polyprenyl synthetase family protein [Streptomyces sp. SID6673]